MGVRARLVAVAVLAAVLVIPARAGAEGSGGPPAPTGQHVWRDGGPDGRVLLGWDGPSGTPDDFVVEQTLDDGGTWTTLNVGDGDCSVLLSATHRWCNTFPWSYFTYHRPSLHGDNVQPKWRVRAVANGVVGPGPVDGEGQPLWIPVLPDAATPTGLQAAFAGTPTQLSLSWDVAAATLDLTSEAFRVERLDGGAWTLAPGEVDVEHRRYTEPLGLAAATASYRVRSISQDGRWSEPSEPLEVALPAKPPAPVFSVATTSTATITTVHLAWTQPGGPVDAYEVYSQSLYAGPWSLVEGAAIPPSLTSLDFELPRADVPDDGRIVVHAVVDGIRSDASNLISWEVPALDTSTRYRLVGDPDGTTVVTKEDRESEGVKGFTDGGLGFSSATGGLATFHVSAEGASTVLGTRDAPLDTVTAKTAEVSDLRPVAVKGDLRNVPAAMSEGGPVYVDPVSGGKLLFYHSEYYVGFEGEPDGRQDNAVGVAYAAPGTTDWSDRGFILHSEQPRHSIEEANAEAGTGQYTIWQDPATGEDYFLVYFTDSRVLVGEAHRTQWITVARAKVSDVMDAVRRDETPTFWKYCDDPERCGTAVPVGTEAPFVQPGIEPLVSEESEVESPDPDEPDEPEVEPHAGSGLGGISTPILPSDVGAVMSVMRSDCLGGYYLVDAHFSRYDKAHPPPGGPYTATRIRTSTDGIHWSAPDVVHVGRGVRMYSSIAPRDLRDPMVAHGAELDIYSNTHDGDMWTSARMSRLSFVDTQLESQCADGSTPQHDGRPTVGVAPVTATSEMDGVNGGTTAVVQLSRPLDHPLTVSYWTSDRPDQGEEGYPAAKAGVDYTVWGTPNAPRTLTIPTGSMAATIAVPIKPDGLQEFDERFRIHIRTDDPDVRLGDSVSTVTIRDLAPALLGTPQFVVNDVNSAHDADVGTSAKSTARAYLTKSVDEPVVIRMTTHDGTATSGAGQDFGAINGQLLTIAPGGRSLSRDITIHPNTVAKGNKTFTIEWEVVSGPSSLVGQVRTSTITIADDDD